MLSLLQPTPQLYFSRSATHNQISLFHRVNRVASVDFPWLADEINDVPFSNAPVAKRSAYQYFLLRGKRVQGERKIEIRLPIRDIFSWQSRCDLRVKHE